MALQKNVNIRNRKARFQYEITSTYVAGIVLKGTEIKAIREGKASIGESFCEFNSRGELFVINMSIQEYSHASAYSHNPRNERKLLLNKSELRKLEKEVKNVGFTIIPVRMFTNKRGLAKLEIGLAKGKKLHDKRESLKSKESQRDLKRIQKAFNA